jgi:hypothetical protein
MKIKFQDWIESNHFSEDADHLLESSVVCYKSGAYSASLLMAYLGFLVVLKERLMQALKPALFPQNTWDTMIRNLQNENQWEEALVKALNRQEIRDSAKVKIQDPVFVIHQNIKDQITYWRGRRNDCAHHRDNAIRESHVESFWSFLEGNLWKITVEGGRATLINKFTRHYDSRYTPAGADVMPLIGEIKHAVEKSEMQDFWESLFAVTNNLMDYEEEVGLIRKILSLNDVELTASLIKYISAQQNLLYGCINEFPSLLIHLNWDGPTVRNFWKTKLLPMRNVIGVFATMLRNSLIPTDEINDAMQHVAKMLKYTDDQDDHLILKNNNFGKHIYAALFVQNNGTHFHYWKYMNANCSLYTQYIKLYPLKDEVVTILCEELAKPAWKSEFLIDSLNKLFKSDNVKKQEFINKAAALGVALPENITELFG